MSGIQFNSVSGRLALVAALVVGTIPLAFATNPASDDRLTDVRLSCGSVIEVYLEAFATLRIAGSPSGAAIPWRNSYVYKETTGRFSKAKNVSFECLNKGRKVEFEFGSYWGEKMNPAPTVRVVSSGIEILPPVVLDTCNPGGDRWPKCPRNFAVRVAVWFPDDTKGPDVYVQRFTGEFIQQPRE